MGDLWSSWRALITVKFTGDPPTFYVFCNIISSIVPDQ